MSRLPCLACASLLMTVAMAAASVPYVWNNVVIGGGGFVTGVVFHPTERGLAYARTDVGGAYRRDSPTGDWIPLLDGFGASDWNLQGVESVAVDPTDSQRVYLAVGTYTTPEAGPGEILRSTDRGATWNRTLLPFKCGANEAGRGSGERLVVDPHRPNILYLGTRRDGLWRSTDHAATWTRVAGFPDIPDDSRKHIQPPQGPFNYLAQAVGVVWVRIDAGSGTDGNPTPVVYAAISRTGESIFRSTDAGATWAAVPGQPTNFRPTGAALAPDGTLYVSYADEPGPDRMGNGALWRFSPASGRWTDLTPEVPDPANPERRFGYATVAVDPTDPTTLLASTWNRRAPGDEIFRSTDGGRSWRPLLSTSTWCHDSAPYTATMHPHWISCVVVDPFDRDRITFNTGYGLWTSRNARAADRREPVRWVFDNRGLEETVPLALISPPAGAHLISGVGDIDGFVHGDLRLSPSGGRFPAPGYKNTEWLDYAARAPQFLVRAGTAWRDGPVLAASSSDGGISWSPLAGEPPHPGDQQGRTTGPVAISADGGLISWTPSGGHPCFTSDRGRTWRVTSRLPVNLALVADRVESTTFYGYDASSGRLHVSRDGGRKFCRLPTRLPPAGRENPTVDLAAVPDRPGELWLAAGGRLFRLTEFGRVAHEFPECTGVQAVGYGRPAAGADHPTVFIAGLVAGVAGVYRSDDTGRTWVQLTDARHQFGTITKLTGDSRIYGRVYLGTGGRGIVVGDPAP